MKLRHQRRAVAPVIATLLMIAVAVAMSVIIFMWSQGFLSQTSSATGGQQGSQNQAAQSSIAIEIGTFVVSPATNSATAPALSVTVRNVGAVTVTLGGVTVTGSSANSGFTGNLIYQWTTTASQTVTSSDCTWQIDSSHDVSTQVQLSKGTAATFTLTETGTAALCGSGGAGTTRVLSGDVVNVKVTTTVGTFAQAQFTVP